MNLTPFNNRKTITFGKRWIKKENSLKLEYQYNVGKYFSVYTPTIVLIYATTNTNKDYKAGVGNQSVGYIKLNYK